MIQISSFVSVCVCVSVSVSVCVCMCVRFITFQRWSLKQSSLIISVTVVIVRKDANRMVVHNQPSVSVREHRGPYIMHTLYLDGIYCQFCVCLCV